MCGHSEAKFTLIYNMHTYFTIYHNYHAVTLYTVSERQAYTVKDKNSKSCHLHMRPTAKKAILFTQAYGVLQNNQCKINLLQLPREAEK